MELQYLSVCFGADPELFLSKNGKVIGAEKVLPKGGIGQENRVIIDGVQTEFNVYPSTCRQVFSNHLRVCFQLLNQQMQGTETTADFSQTVKVDKEEMESLAEESRQFGCSPSKNAYRDAGISIKDASKYYSRSAGGHIHLGDGGYELTQQTLARHTEVVQMLDILLGNTCVLLDRDPGNIERRKTYGRAGEYRTPKHGLEYRTLSNFWLKSYALMSFVLGMARFAVTVTNNEEIRTKLLAAVNMDDIERAINENDFELAYKNFDAIKDIIKDIGVGEPYWPLQGVRMDKFEVFVKQGVDHYFKQDPMEHWLHHDYHTNPGWESFIDAVVVEPKKPIKQAIKKLIAVN